MMRLRRKFSTLQVRSRIRILSLLPLPQLTLLFDGDLYGNVKLITQICPRKKKNWTSGKRRENVIIRFDYGGKRNVRRQMMTKEKFPLRGRLRA